MLNEKAIDNFIMHFQNDDFQKELKSVRDDLYSIFIEFIEFIKTNKLVKENQLIISAPEARVKGAKSLKEKIIRKKYYEEWTLTEDLQFDDCKNLSLNKLPDLIGLRINCYFFDDEKYISDLFLSNESVIEYFSNKKISFKTDFLELPHETIYKFNGKFKRFTTTYNFELQLKSLVHSMWGEVDHKTIYKEQQYDINRSLKKKMELGVFENLKTANTQLLDIYTNSHNESDLVKALFFEYTKDKISETLKIPNVQSKYYYFFFNVFKTDYFFNLIRSYISSSVIHSEFTKIVFNKLCFTDEIKTELHQELIKELKKVFDDRKYSYIFENFLAIMNCLYQTITKEELLSFIAYLTIDEVFVESDFDFSTVYSETDDIEDDDVEDSENSNNDLENAKQDLINSSLKLIKERISKLD